MGRFEGKVCIVTGGASGIGAKTAEMFVEQGGCVVVTDVNDAAGEKLVGDIGASKAAYLHLDVTDPDACQAGVDLAVEKFGSVDYLLNSAVKMAPGMLKDLSLADWNTMVNIGLTGSFLMTQAVGNWLIENERPGSVVMMSSIGGRQPYGMSGAYSTVKAAVKMLADHFGIEWGGYNIRVNSIVAGHIETPLTAYLKDPEIKRGRSEVTPLGRVGQPVDIANAVLFLFSDEADYVTATALNVDGGITRSVMNHMPGRKWS